MMFHSFLVGLVARLIWVYIYFVACTSRITWVQKSILDDTLQKYPSLIYTSWHGRQVFLTWVQRKTKAWVLISKSKDGEFIARAIELFGMRSVRGSSSKGGAEALMQLKQKLDEGGCLGVTPDGPRGPQRRVKDGIIFLAQKTGKPILPMVWSSKRKWIFKAWDDFWVPKPFNHIAVAYSQPVYVEKTDDPETKKQELEQKLNLLTDQTDQIFIK